MLPNAKTIMAIAVSCLLLLSSGCALIAESDQADRAGRAAQKAVDAWCDNVPEESRQEVREKYFPTPDGNSGAITCARDTSGRIWMQEPATGKWYPTFEGGGIRTPEQLVWYRDAHGHWHTTGPARVTIRPD